MSLYCKHIYIHICQYLDTHCSFSEYFEYRTKAQLLQRDRTMLRVNEYFAKSLKVI